MIKYKCGCTYCPKQKKVTKCKVAEALYKKQFSGNYEDFERYHQHFKDNEPDEMKPAKKEGVKDLFNN